MRILETERYAKWYHRLKDAKAKTDIDARLRRFTIANKPVGDIKPVGDGVSELRIHTGPGYRIYFAEKRGLLVILLVGGDKSSQNKDISTAKNMLAELKETGQW